MAKKPTRFLTNSPCIVEALKKRSAMGGHKQTVIKSRPPQQQQQQKVQVYPPGLCKAIFKTIEKQLVIDEIRRNNMARDMLNSLEVGDDKTAEQIYWDDSMADG